MLHSSFHLGSIELHSSTRREIFFGRLIRPSESMGCHTVRASSRVTPDVLVVLCLVRVGLLSQQLFTRCNSHRKSRRRTCCKIRLVSSQRRRLLRAQISPSDRPVISIRGRSRGARVPPRALCIDRSRIDTRIQANQALCSDSSRWRSTSPLPRPSLGRSRFHVPPSPHQARGLPPAQL